MLILIRPLSTSGQGFGPSLSRKKIVMSETNGKVRFVVTWFLRVLLGLTFLGIGIEKLTGTMGTIPFFDAIGWGQWFRYATGALDIAGDCSSSCRAGPPSVLSSLPALWDWEPFSASPLRCTIRFSRW